MIRARRWLALAIGVVALFLASWIFLPAPTYFLLTFGVGAPEVSAWIALAALAGVGLTLLDVRRSITARAAAVFGLAALALSVTPLARVPAVVREFGNAMRGMSAEPASPARAQPLVVADLFRGVQIGHAKTTIGVPFAQYKDRRLTLDVYQPDGGGRHPVLVQIYGGAWQRGDPSANSNFATWLSSRGWVVFAIDYRHAPALRWPTQLNDVDSALTWVRAHAGAFGGDTARVVLMGRSSGGHLALLAAYRHPPLSIRGVVSYYGPTDLVDSYRHPPHPDPLEIRSIEETFIGAPLDSAEELYRAASPITYVTRPLPPTLLIHGGRDHVVEARYGKQLADRLAATGTPVVFLEIPWAEHAFDAVFNGPSSQIAL